MGVWGLGLYQDDFAADLKGSISLVAKVPGTGEQMFGIIQSLYPPRSLDEDQTTFWLVLADQFERRGLACAEVTRTALGILDSGEDIARLENQGVDERGLFKRAEVLNELAARLRKPRPTRPAPKRSKPPEFVVDVGEVYAFPTMKGAAVNAWFDSWETAGFVPDGWGALVVLDRGRAFDWLPWCAVASLNVDPQQCPSLGAAVSSALLLHPQTHGAARCVPNRNHMKRMRSTLLGTIRLDSSKARAIVSKLSVEKAIELGWSISSAAFSKEMAGLPMGPNLNELLGGAS